MKNKKKGQNAEKTQISFILSLLIYLLDGRMPTPGGRPTYTLSTHKTSQKTRKIKIKEKKVKKDKISRFRTFFFPVFSFLSAWLIFIESGGRTSSGRATTGINHKNQHVMVRKVRVGDDGDQSGELMRDSEQAHFRGGTSLSFSFSHFVSLLSAQLISTGSHGRTSIGRATTGRRVDARW